MIIDLLCFLWKRDSESAFCSLIGAAAHMSVAHLREAAAYLTNLANDVEYRSNSNHG